MSMMYFLFPCDGWLKSMSTSSYALCTDTLIGSSLHLVVAVVAVMWRTEYLILQLLSHHSHIRFSTEDLSAPTA